jgi:hypothetical protein
MERDFGIELLRKADDRVRDVDADRRRSPLAGNRCDVSGPARRSSIRMSGWTLAASSRQSTARLVIGP